MNETARSAPRLSLARLARYLAVALAAFLLLCAVAALSVPLLVQQVVLDRLGAAIGRQVTIERTRFNPFKLALTAQGARIAALDPAADFITVESLRVDFSISSIRHLAPVIEALKIEAPVVRLQRTAPSRFNFSDIVERLAAAPEEREPAGRSARFALHNLELSGGAIDFDDKVLEQVHRLTDLRLDIPFIANLDDNNPTQVEPSLSARIDGSPLELHGTSLPFSASRETSLEFRLQDLELASYLRLSPVPLGFSLPKGRLGSDLKLRFAQQPDGRTLVITGSARLDDLQLDAVDGPRLLLARRVALGIVGVEPLADRYAFGELKVDGLALDLTRLRDGELAMVRAFSAAPAAKAGKQPDVADAAAAAREEAAAKVGGAGDAVSAAPATEWSIRQTTLRDGRVVWRDETVAPPVVLDHHGISIDLAAIGNRQAAPAAAKLSLKQNEASGLSWQGQLDLAKSRAAGAIDAQVASVAPYLPYAATLLAARLESGAIAVKGDLAVDWAGDFKLDLAKAQASVERARLTLPDEAEAAVAIGRLAVQGVALSLAERRLQASRAALSDADIRVQREAQGVLNLQRLLAPAADNQAPGSEAKGSEAKGSRPGSDVKRSDGTAKSAGASGWRVAIDKLELDGNRVAWRDLGTPKPVEVPITGLGGSVGPLGTDLAARSDIDLRARIGKDGMLKATGNLAIQPLSLQLDLQLQRLALAPFDPYVAEQLALEIDEGALDGSGKLRYQEGRVAYAGRLEVGGLRSRERDSDRETIRWKRLLLEAIDLDVDPTQLGPKDRIAIGNITLSDFFARILLSEDGRLNLQDLVRRKASDHAAPAAGGDNAGPVIRLGGIKLEQGRSSFTDRFVRPNYSVNLTDLNGGVSAMASDHRVQSDVALTGRVGGNSPIDISGKIDPLGPALAADIRAKANGIELPPLTPYSTKYIGYTIEKGKLNLDVHYRIENDRLEAQNRVLLDQLTLGEKVASPDATNLPVQFALGLLKNSKGEIDVSLPIEGSLDDPQFSIRGLIGNAILNLLTKAVTAPFSALAAAFGGGKEELSYVEFQRGSARLAQESARRLQLIAKALLERPALKLEIAGRVDPAAEQDAIRRERLDARLRALKRRETGSAGSQRESLERQEEAATAAGVTVTPEEYPALLQRLYDESDLPDKPRNSLGVARRLEADEMEKLLLASIAVDADAARRLGIRRAQTVQRWLASQGKVPEDRMFLLASRVNPAQAGPNQSQPQCTASCAEFSLR